MPREELWRYPCDVFLRVACFRLPTGMAVDYSVPADFGFYKITMSNELIISIYSGAAPQKSGFDDEPSFRLESSDSTLTAFFSDRSSQGRLDVYLVPVSGLRDTVHIFTDVNPTNQDKVVHVLSGFRPCASEPKRQFTCPESSDWGKELANWLRNARKAG
jgi:hypothetical protein